MGYYTLPGEEERAPQDIAAAGIPVDPNQPSDTALSLRAGFDTAGQILMAPVQYGLEKVGEHELAANVGTEIARSKYAQQLTQQEMTPEGQAAMNAPIIGGEPGQQTFWDDPWESFKLQSVNALPLMITSIVPAAALAAAGPVIAVGGAAATGAYMGAGETIDAINTEIDGMSHEELMAGSPVYRHMVEAGEDPDAARDQIKEMVNDEAAPISALLSGALNLVGPEAMLAKYAASKAVGEVVAGKTGTGLVKSILGHTAVGAGEETVEGAIPAVGEEYAGQTVAGKDFDFLNVFNQALQEGMVSLPFAGLGGVAEARGHGPRVERVNVAGPDAALTTALTPPGSTASVPPVTPPSAVPEAEVRTPQGPGTVQAPGTEAPPPGAKVEKTRRDYKKGKVVEPGEVVEKVPVVGPGPAMTEAITPPANVVRGNAQELLLKRAAEENPPAPPAAPVTPTPPMPPAPAEQVAPPVPAPELPAQVTPEAEVTPPPAPVQPESDLAAGVDMGVQEEAPQDVAALAPLEVRGVPRILPDLAAQKRRQDFLDAEAAKSEGEARGKRYEEDAQDPAAVRAWRLRKINEVKRLGEEASPIAKEAAGIRGAQGKKLSIPQTKRLQELMAQEIAAKPKKETKPAKPSKAETAAETEAQTALRVADVAVAPGRVTRDLDKMTREIAREAQHANADPGVHDRVNDMVEIMDAITKRPDVQEKINNTPILQEARQLKKKLDAGTATPEEIADFEAKEKEFIKPTQAELEGETQDISMGGLGSGGMAVSETGPSELGGTIPEGEDRAPGEEAPAGAAETEVTAGKKKVVPIGESEEAFERKAKEHTSEVRRPKLSPEELAKYETKGAPKKEEPPGVQKVKEATKRVAEKKAAPKPAPKQTAAQKAQSRQAAIDEAGRALIDLHEQARDNPKAHETIAQIQAALVDALGAEDAAKVNQQVNAAVAARASNTPLVSRMISREKLKRYIREHGKNRRTTEVLKTRDNKPIRIHTWHTTNVSDALNTINFTELSKYVRENYFDQAGDLHDEMMNVLLPKLREEAGGKKVFVIPDRVFDEHMDYEGDAALYLHHDGHIYIRQSVWENADKGRRAFVLLHEMSHAAFGEIARKNKTVHDIIDDMRNLVAEEMRGDELFYDQLFYGLTDVQETIAETYSNPYFRETMAKIQMPDSMAKRLGMQDAPNKSVWAGFVNLVRRVFGMKPGSYSMLEGIIHATNQKVPEAAPAIDDEFTRALLAATEGDTPFTSSLKRSATNAIKLPKDVTGRPAKAGFLNKILLKLVTLHQKAQMAARYFTKELTAPISQIVEKTRLRKTELINQAEKFFLTEMNTLSTKDPENYTKMVDIGQASTAAEVDPTVPLDHKNNKHIAKTGARGRFARRVHAQQSQAFLALPQEFKDLWHKSQKYFLDTQNNISRLAIENAVEQALGRADKQLAERIFNNEITPADEAVFKTNAVLSAFHGMTEMKRIKGTYFPQMRRGDIVVHARYKLPEWKKNRARTKDGKLTAQAYDFHTEAEFNRFVDDMHKRGLTVTSVSSYHVDDQGNRSYSYVDPKTGELTKTKKGETKFFSYRKGDTGTHEVFRARVQDKLVEFHEGKETAEASRAALRADPNYDDEVVLEQRENFDIHTSKATSLQIRRAARSLQQSARWDRMSEQERAAALQGLRELSLNFLGSTSPLNRARPRRNVMGASRDMVRNIADYASSSAGTIASLENRPALDKAFDALKDYKDRNHHDDMSGPRSQLLRSMYEDAYAKDIAPTKTNRLGNALLTISFMDKLVSPAFHLINSLQPWMISLPVMAGRHGYARSSYELGRAYRDMGFGQVLRSGLADTIKATRDHLEGTTDYIADIRKRLAKLPDGDELNAMLDKLHEWGLIDKDSGLEFAEMLLNPSKPEKFLHRADHIVRQFGTAVEVMNRAPVAIAAYRMERAKGASIADATHYAQETVANTQGNYSFTNSPALFRHPLARMALQFKKYSQLMGHVLAKLAYNVFKGATPAEKMEAAKTLGGLLIAHIAMAGFIGLPTEPLKYPWMLLSYFLPMPSWEEAETAATEFAQSYLGENMGDAIAHGLPRLAGVDMSSRLGLNSLLAFGTPRGDKDTDIKSWVFDQVSGAPTGMLTDWVKGAHDISQGNYADAFERMIPIKLLSDSIRAYRRGTEGTFSKRGEQTSEGYGIAKGILQGVGFKPAEEAVRQEKTSAFYNAKGRRDTLRRSLIDRFLSGEDRPQVRKEIIQYNGSVPKEARITMKGLKSLAKKKITERKKGYIKQGVYGGKMNKDLLQKYLGG